MHFDFTIHVPELLVALGIAWRAIVAMNKLTFTMENFPPHKHVGKRIQYPKGYEGDATVEEHSVGASA